MDPLTSWVLLIVVGIPWTVGAVALVKRLSRADREPMRVGEQTVRRLERR